MVTEMMKLASGDKIAVPILGGDSKTQVTYADLKQSLIHFSSNAAIMKQL